jgi:hypothetical protein
MQSADTDDALRVEKQRHFVRAMSKSIEGQPLTPTERSLLDALFEALLRGEDVSELTGVRRAHTRRSSDHVYVALHYLCLTRLMGTPSEAAWSAVADAWRLSKRDAQRLIAQSREPAMSALNGYSASPERLLRVCEQRARGARPEGRQLDDDATEHKSGDPLIFMLARLCGTETSATH